MPAHARARAGLLHAPHGIVETPEFMPAGTRAVPAAGPYAPRIRLPVDVDGTHETDLLDRFGGGDQAVR